MHTDSLCTHTHTHTHTWCLSHQLVRARAPMARHGQHHTHAGLCRAPAVPACFRASRATESGVQKLTRRKRMPRHLCPFPFPHTHMHARARSAQALIFGLHMYKNSYPTNMVLLGLFTLIESFTVSVVCAHYEVAPGVLVSCVRVWTLRCRTHGLMCNVCRTMCTCVAYRRGRERGSRREAAGKGQRERGRGRESAGGRQREKVSGREAVGER